MRSPCSPARTAPPPVPSPSPPGTAETCSPRWRPSTPTAATPAAPTGLPTRSTAGPSSRTHTAGTLTLTSDLLSALKDGQRATLTFHFWSGAKVTYHVTRTGTTVTGSTS
ncbi:hypothetical protein [Streptomyces sp. D2-8]|uniref:hypothetical protein n=1 Tax=Streptomyces sp. D2-8 TaxID=2707767 RepID=UPI0027E5A84F|nr:hypothetical protein [Streptomyces sp. D2-8]